MNKLNLSLIWLTVIALCGVTFTSCDDTDDKPTTVTFQLDKESVPFTYLGGETTVKVTPSGDAEWKTTCPETWVEVTDGANQFMVKVGLNEKEDDREATITISAPNATDKTIKVTQSGYSKTVVFNVDDTPIDFVAAGGEKDILIQANIEWSATKVGDWFEIVEKHEDGLVAINASENLTLVPKSGEVIVKAEGQQDVTVKITQQAVLPYIEIVYEEDENVPFSTISDPWWGEDYIGVVKSNFKYEFLPLDDDIDWVDTSIDYAKNLITVSLDTNPDQEFRTCKIYVGAAAGEVGTENLTPYEITIVQHANPSAGGGPAVDKVDVNFPVGGGTDIINVTDLPGPEWDVQASSASWLKIEKISQMLSAYVELTAEPNTTGSPRTSDVRIIHKMTQALTVVKVYQPGA